MTGFSQPADPDDDPAEAQQAAAKPMTPDEPGLPEHDSVSPAFEDEPDPDAPTAGRNTRTAGS